MNKEMYIYEFVKGKCGECMYFIKNKDNPPVKYDGYCYLKNRQNKVIQSKFEDCSVNKTDICSYY